MSLPLTIGMATYNDFQGVYWTIQALLLYHAEVMRDVFKDLCKNGGKI